MHYYGSKNLASSWRTVRNNTIQTAEDIPADQYNFRATPDTMSVAELLAHMATNTLWGERVHFNEKMNELGAPQFMSFAGVAKEASASLTSKEAIIAALRENGESIARALEAAPDDLLAESVALPGGAKSRFEMLLGLKEHEMHHRGQLMVMQRMMGIVPHLTRQRQERMAAMAAAQNQA
ncbi:MAG: DinB family protein [Gemmatimonas sp.]